MYIVLTGFSVTQLKLGNPLFTSIRVQASGPVQAGHEETFSCEFLYDNRIFNNFMDKLGFIFFYMLGLLVGELSKAG